MQNLVAVRDAILHLYCSYYITIYSFREHNHKPMSFYSKRVTKLIKAIPGEKTLGVYRFLPLFFLLGAALEFSMINWTVGETNFCKFFNKFLLN